LFWPLMSGHDGIQRRLAFSCNTKRYSHRMFLLTPDNMPACVFVWDNARIKLVAVLQQQAPVRAMVSLSPARSRRRGTPTSPCWPSWRHRPWCTSGRPPAPHASPSPPTVCFLHFYAIVDCSCPCTTLFLCLWQHRSRQPVCDGLPTEDRLPSSTRWLSSLSWLPHPLSHLHVTTHADSFTTFSYI